MSTYFEFQIRPGRLAQLFRAGFVQLGALDIAPVFSLSGEDAIVDGFELREAPEVVAAAVGDVNTLGLELRPVAAPGQPPSNPNIVVPEQPHSVSGRKLVLVRQLVTVRMVHLSALASGVTPVPTQQTEIRLDFVLTAGKTTTNELQFRFQHVESELGPVLGSAPNAAALESSLLASLDSFPVTQWQRLDALVATSTSPSLAELEVRENYFFSIHASTGTVAFRAELGLPSAASSGLAGTLAIMTEFLQGTFADRLGATDREWSVVIHQNQIRLGFWSQMMAWEGALGLIDDVVTDPVPTPSWNTGSARCETQVRGAIEDACHYMPGLFHDIDFAVDTRLSYELPLPDQLRIRLRLDWSVSTSDEALCVAAMTIAGPILAPAMTQFGATGTLSPAKALTANQYFLANLGGPLAYLFGTIAVMSRGLDFVPIFAPAGFTETNQSDGDREFTRDLAFDLVLAKYRLPDTGTYAEVRSHLTHVQGVPLGLLMSGHFDMPLLPFTAASLRVAPSAGTMDWSWDALCSSANRQLVAGKSVALSNDAIEHADEFHQPLRLLGYEVLDDPHDQYGPYVEAQIEHETGHVSVKVPSGALKQEFLDDPYPLRILVRTTGGARILDLGTLQEMTTAEQAALVDSVEALVRARCRPLTSVRERLPFHPEWLIDPPPFLDHHENLWRFHLEGLSREARVDLRAGEGRIAEAVVGEDSTLDLWALTAPETAAPTLTISRGGRGDSAPRVGLRQIQLARLGEAKLGSPAREVSFARSAGTEVVVLGADDVTVFSLSDPAHPRMLARVSERFDGVVEWGGGVALWSKRGIFRLRDGELERVVEGRVSRVVAAGSRLLALRGEELLTLNGDLELDRAAASRLGAQMLRGRVARPLSDGRAARVDYENEVPWPLTTQRRNGLWVRLIAPDHLGLYGVTSFIDADEARLQEWAR